MNASYGTLNIEVTTREGKEYLCMFSLFETELSVTVYNTFAVVFTGVRCCSILSHMSQICGPLQCFCKINCKIIHSSTPNVGGGPLPLDRPKKMYVFFLPLSSVIPSKLM